MKHARKMIAPVIVTGIVIALLAAWLAGFISIQGIPPAAKTAVGAVMAVLSGMAVFVLVQRIKEIRSGDEDDLGKY